MGNEKKVSLALDSVKAFVGGQLEKIRQANQRRQEAKETRMDDIYDSLRLVGVENLKRLREADPQASPLETIKKLETAFLSEFSLSHNNQEKADAIDQFVLTGLEIHDLKGSGPEVRREAILFIEKKRKQLKVGSDAGRIGKMVLTAGEILLLVAPVASDFAKASNLKLGKSAEKALRVLSDPKVQKSAGVLRGVTGMVKMNIQGSDVDRKALAQAREHINKVKTIFGAPPENWEPEH